MYIVNCFENLMGPMVLFLGAVFGKSLWIKIGNGAARKTTASSARRETTSPQIA